MHGLSSALPFASLDSDVFDLVTRVRWGVRALRILLDSSVFYEKMLAEHGSSSAGGVIQQLAGVAIVLGTSLRKRTGKHHGSGEQFHRG
jgi:hypothetical protein